MRIDPRLGLPTGDPENVSCTGDALALGAGGVWCFDPVSNRGLTRFDTTADRVDVAMRPDQRSGGTALATSPGSVWVVQREGLTLADEAETHELKKSNRLLEQENEILRRAAA